MAIPRRLAIAAATAVTVGSVTAGIMPSHSPDAGARHDSRDFRYARELELRGSEAKADTLRDAINADSLRSAEVRAADGAAEAAARDMLEHP
jgi:hypothetical protein